MCQTGWTIAISHQRICEEAVNHFLATCILFPSHFYPVSRLKNPPLETHLIVGNEETAVVDPARVHPCLRLKAGHNLTDTPSFHHDHAAVYV